MLGLGVLRFDEADVKVEHIGNGTEQLQTVFGVLGVFVDGRNQLLADLSGAVVGRNGIRLEHNGFMV